MKLVSVQLGRALWLFPLSDMNPTGKHILPVAVELVKRYAFATVPNITEAIKKQEGMIFSQGVFNHAPVGDIQVQLSLYNDGLVADTSTDTEASEAFLEDFISWLTRDMGLRAPEITRRLYSSELYVAAERALLTTNPRLTAFSQRLNEVSKGYREATYELSSIAFTAPQTSSHVNPPFRLEREVNQPDSANRFYSTAGLKTREHLELLEELEAALET